MKPGVLAIALPLMALSASGPASGQDASPTPLTVEEARHRIEALKRERTKLQEELRSALSDDAKLIDAPQGDILIGLPTSLVREIVSEALTGPLKNVRLLLKDVVKVQRKDVIKAKTFLGMMTLGHYELTVYVQEVHASMKPKTPTLTFGANRIAIDLPVSVESGDVKASLIFKWDGRKLAGAVCGDLTSEHDLRAKVPPLMARLRGRFEVRARGEQLVVNPVMEPIQLAFQVEPQQRTWDFIDNLIESRNAVCEAALRKAAVGQKVKDLVAQGFKTKVPTTWLRPMSLLASFRDTVEVNGQSAGFAITPSGVSVTKDRIWYGARLAVRKEAAPLPRAKPKPTE